MPLTKINTSRVFVGGLVAAIVIFIIEGVVNGVFLSREMQNWAITMGTNLQPPAMSVSMCLWILMALISGIGGVWFYAVARPRLGPGAKTGLIVAIMVWFVSKAPMALDFFSLGLLPTNLIVGQFIGSFVSSVVGIYVGAMLYKEV